MDEGHRRLTFADGSRIGKTMRLEGSIKARENLTVLGKVKGTIDIPDKQVTISKEGRVEADIRAKHVLIKGTVRGDIKGVQRAELESNADLVGKLETHQLRVEEGAVFRGQVDIIS